ncbi:hypothetical protein EX30DRAFT_370199 [Ascodesmis nigricans]|uniref:NADH-ubiquinone oxidoreductase 9.5 kDa subunit n=1 Tax=Ascodesmis nigricans TaxID=341454 RepID=A0A4V3SJA0_9PEZI|nr:hypothetical protein EX30DRAFT_370199 [Ascodesmis nigricans]
MKQFRPPLHEPSFPYVDPQKIFGRPPPEPTRPNLFNNPIRYMRWAAITNPAPFWSVVIGVSAVPISVALLLYRHYTGWEDHTPVPRTWPIPHRKREPLNDGGIYDDPK